MKPKIKRTGREDRPDPVLEAPDTLGGTDGDERDLEPSAVVADPDELPPALPEEDDEPI